jgi:hypothetical protein
MLVIMNNKLLLISLVSLGAIVQLPQSAHAQAFSAESVKNPEPSLEVSEMPNLSSVNQSVAVRSIAAPEVTNDRTNPLQVEVPQAPAQVSAQVTQDPTIASTATPTVAAQPTEAKPIEAKPIVQTIAQASYPSAMTTTIPVKIEVGSRGIPTITNLPERIALPPVGLLPGNFELPINMQQAVDSSISTSSPITDRLADPALSEHLQTVQTFISTKPEAMTIPCNSLPTADCSPIMKPVNPNAYAAKGLSLRSEDPAANPDSPSAIGPIVNERLRTTVDEMQAYQSAYSQNLVAWSDRVRQCMDEKPRMYVMRSDGAQLPVFFNGQEGTVVRNASGQAVCSN